MQEDSSNATMTMCDVPEERLVFPASFAQQRLWLLNQFEPLSPLYNMPNHLRLSGRLDFSALERALNEIISRHEILRTSFAMLDRQLVQLIAPPSYFDLPLTDLQHLPVHERQTVAYEMATQDARRPFDLARGPLLRLELLRLSQDEHVLLLNMHHIIADGWSVSVFLNELSRLYISFSRGEESRLEELPIQYADYAEWQREYLSGEVLEEQVSYWTRQLGTGRELPVLELGRGRAAAGNEADVETQWRGGYETIELDEELKQRLNERSRAEGVTLFMLLLAAWEVLLYRYTGQRDIVVGTPVANRTRAEVEGLIGFFVNTLVLRVKVAGRESFRELLKQVREVTIGAYEHQEMPFERLVEVLQPERSVSHSPLFQVMFTLQNTPTPMMQLDGLRLEPIPVAMGTAKAELSLGVFESERGLKVWIEYREDLFDVTFIRGMLQHYKTLLEAVVLDPVRRVSDLPLLGEGERLQMVAEWNETAHEYDAGQCINHLLEAHAARAPGSLAVVFEDERVSYGELNSRANQIAHYLHRLGVRVEGRVGILLERGVLMIESVLAVLKAGGAYVPLDVQHPRDRLGYMLKDSGASVLLTESKLAEELRDVDGLRVICLDVEHERIAQESTRNIDSGATADNLAYIIYTSGSTGRPKGVMVGRRGLCNLAVTLEKTFELDAESRVLQFASLGFDASIFEIVMAFSVGATLCLGRRETLLPGPDFIKLLQEQSVTVATLPPSLLAAMPDAELPALKVLCVAGESCPAEVSARWSKGRRFFNLYGLTEATVWSTSAECTDCEGRPSIGRPILNTQMYLLDADLHAVPAGISGEIYLGGVGVARGYLNRPGLTAERFLPNPFSGEPGARLYRTGDLARYLPHGEIEFLGRVDQQVKIRGFRVELGEIESVLMRHPRIRQAGVFERHTPTGEKRLVAYLVTRGEVMPGASELRNYLTRYLPGYMIPSAFVRVEAFPVTVNGKIDTRALPEPEWRALEAESASDAPRNFKERLVIYKWEKLLGTTGIGIYDNFFDVGGNSLIMMQSIRWFKKAFDVDFPVAAFYNSPTVEAIAETIRTLQRSPLLEEAVEVLGEGAQALARAPIVALQTAGSKPPFFCIHTIGGHLGEHRELAQELRAYEQPVYGLQARGLDQGEDPYATLEEMAATYADAMLRFLPGGPFRLGGYCSGGVVAFEVARQLQARGHEVSNLVLMGSQVILSDSASMDGANRDAEVSSAVYFAGELKVVVSPDDLRALNADEKMEKVWEEFCQQSPVDSARLGRTIFGRLYRVYLANMMAISNYRPRPYHGRVALFEFTEQHEKFNLRVGWEPLCLGALDYYEVPGNRITLMRQPHVKVLAQTLDACLNSSSTRRTQ